MGDLAVTVSLRGKVIEDRVLKVRAAVRLGEGEGAAVSFPAADLIVARSGEALLVRGRTLAEGERLTLALGAVHVTLAHLNAERLGHDLGLNFDFRFLAVAAIAAALTTWLDAAAAALVRTEPGSRGAEVTRTAP